MISHFPRRNFSLQLVSLFPLFGLARRAFAWAEPIESSNEISHTSEAIHQEVVFTASRKRVYDALTQTEQFGKVVRLSAAGPSLKDNLARISPEVGGDFSLFGGYIVGRHVDLVVNSRIVQAWRTGSWNPGVFSIARFELADEGPNTRLVFDHTGFPQGLGQHLAQGWHENYWEPLKKFLTA